MQCIPTHRLVLLVFHGAFVDQHLIKQEKMTDKSQGV